MTNRKPIVLVVEDCTADFVLLEWAFRRHQVNAELLSARDGDEALDLVYNRFLGSTTEKLELILLDISMPGMNGLETLRLLRSHSELDSIPFRSSCSPNRALSQMSTPR